MENVKILSRKFPVCIKICAHPRRKVPQRLLPEAGRGILTAGTLAWARALGEFGPLLIFAGATRMKTEVLSTTVFLEMSIGNLEGAVAVSLLMVGCAVTVLVIARIWGSRGLSV